MRHHLELEIHRLFQEHRNSIRVADQILRKWGEYNIREKEQAGLFLARSGYLSSFFEQIARSLRNREGIPWGCLIEVLGITKAQLTKDDIDAILLGAAEEDSLMDLVRSRALDYADPRFSKIRTELRKDNPKLAPMKPQPRSPLHEPSHKTPHKTSVSLLEYEKRLSEAVNPVERKKIVNALKGIASQDPGLAYIVAVSLHMMEFFEDALDVLADAPSSLSKDWFELELLLSLKQYLKVLEKCHEMVDQTSDEDPRPMQYYAAMAYYGLDEKSQAIEILERLISERPDFELARVLLHDWKTQKK